MAGRPGTGPALPGRAEYVVKTGSVHCIPVHYSTVHVYRTGTNMLLKGIEATGILSRKLAEKLTKWINQIQPIA